MMPGKEVKRMPSKSDKMVLNKKDYEALSMARQGVIKKQATDAGIRGKPDKKTDLNWGDFALGAIVGIGAYLVFRALTEDKK
jgi:hypothetical protein